MADFDPDVYLNNLNKPAAGSGGFDPDSYLKQFGSPAAAVDEIPTPQQRPPMEWSDVPGQALKNTPHSALEFGKNLVQPIIHPIDTAVGLKNLGMGVLQKAGSWLGVSNSGEYEQYADAVGQHFKDKYGGEENIKRAMAEDPVGVLADVSALLSGGGLALRGTAKVAELANATKTAGALNTTASAASTAGKYTDPLTLAGKAVSAPVTGQWSGKMAPEQQIMEKSKVSMTPFQMMPGPVNLGKRLEDAAASIPILGSFIHSGQQRSIHSFNEAVARQALEPITGAAATAPLGAGKLPKAGHELITHVEKHVGAAYDNLLPAINFVPDKIFHADWQRNLRNRVGTLPPAQQRQFHSIINNYLGSPAPMAGRMLKDIESELVGFSKQYGSSSIAAERQMGQAIGNVVTAIRSNLERVNPNHAAELARINTGWAIYARMREAAQRRKDSGGVFTPSDMLHAIHKGDKTVGHGSYAKGNALMQTFAEAGQKVLPSKLADSGTASRLMVAGGLGAGVAGAPWVSDPVVLAALTAASAPYTRVGMGALNKVVRPVVRNTPWRGAGNTLYRSGQNARVQKEQNPYAP